MHFNENVNREQAKTAAGKERIKIVFPKQKKGDFTPKPIPVNKTYSTFAANAYECLIHYNVIAYVDELLIKTLQFCSCDEEKPTMPIPPPPLASAYSHPDKDTIPLFSRYKQ